MDTSTVITSPDSIELESLRASLQSDLDQIALLAPVGSDDLLNDYYYLEAASRQNDVDKLLVFQKVAVHFRTRMHLVEAVIDIVREDLVYRTAADVVTVAMVEAYRIVLESFAGIGGIPTGAIARATVRAVEAPEDAKALAALIRKKQFV